MKEIKHKTKKEISSFLGIEDKYINWLIEKKGIKSIGRKNRSYLYNQDEIIEEIVNFRKIPYSNLINDILKLYRKYKEFTIALPNGLKGDIGELFSMKRLIEQFPKKSILLFGGTYPGFDILFEKKRIQVKTYFNVENFGLYGFDIEMCPDVKKNFENECEFVFLVQVYLKENEFLDKERTCIYIFDKNDFSYFSFEGCWGSKRGRKTIWNLPIPLSSEKKKELEMNPTVRNKAILFYNSERYRKVFSDSRENWEKLK